MKHLAAVAACALLLAAPGAGSAATTNGEPQAAVDNHDAGTGAGTSAASDPAAGRLRTRLGRRQAETVEQHIQSLHRALHITPAQEPLWKSLADTMRQSVVQLDAVYEQREKRYDEMSAVDNLRSYGEVQEAHARNVQSLIGPFEALYESFSDAQKRIADDTFRKLTDTAVRGTH